jgi:hypothetical protein
VQLIELAVQAAGDRRVADVRVDLTSRRDADAHRLQSLFQMDRVRRNDHPARGHFGAHQFRLQALPLGDKLHLSRRVAGAGMFQLCNRFGHRAKTPPSRATNLMDFSEKQ